MWLVGLVASNSPVRGEIYRSSTTVDVHPPALVVTCVSCQETCATPSCVCLLCAMKIETSNPAESEMVRTVQLIDAHERGRERQ